LLVGLRIDHERFGSRSDPTLNEHLHYPDIDRSLNETTTDKMRKYRDDFLQTHRKTDRCFAVSGVLLAEQMY
jgi:hypothetical protein